MKSKRYRNALNAIETTKSYELSEAVEILKKNNLEASKNLELSFSLCWNAKQNNIRDFVIIPHPVKRERVAIIDENVPAELKNKEGMIFISLEDLPRIISKKKKSSWGFDKLFAHSSISDKLRPFAKTLSLKKSFPNVKDGTLTDDLEKAIADWEKGRVELRNDKGGNFHILLGKTSFELNQIEANYRTLIRKIMNLKPTNWKGEYLKSVTLSTTMGPGIRISI